jgi:hypothetical protein
MQIANLRDAISESKYFYLYNMFFFAFQIYPAYESYTVNHKIIYKVNVMKFLLLPLTVRTLNWALMIILHIILYIMMIFIIYIPRARVIRRNIT